MMLDAEQGKKDNDEFMATYCSYFEVGSGRECTLTCFELFLLAVIGTLAGKVFGTSLGGVDSRRFQDASELQQGAGICQVCSLYVSSYTLAEYPSFGDCFVFS